MRRLIVALSSLDRPPYQDESLSKCNSRPNQTHLEHARELIMLGDRHFADAKGCCFQRESVTFMLSPRALDHKRNMRSVTRSPAHQHRRSPGRALPDDCGGKWALPLDSGAKSDSFVNDVPRRRRWRVRENEANIRVGVVTRNLL